MFPGIYDLGLYRGDTTRLKFNLWQDTAKTIPTDLTGATATAQIRDRPDSPTVTVTLTCTVTLPNTIDVVVPASSDTTIHYRGTWDLQLTYPSGDVQTVVTGAVTASPDTTRAVA